MIPQGSDVAATAADVAATTKARDSGQRCEDSQSEPLTVLFTLPNLFFSLSHICRSGLRSWSEDRWASSAFNVSHRKCWTPMSLVCLRRSLTVVTNLASRFRENV